MGGGGVEGEGVHFNRNHFYAINSEIRIKGTLNSFDFNNIIYPGKSNPLKDVKN